MDMAKPGDRYAGTLTMVNGLVPTRIGYTARLTTMSDVFRQHSTYRIGAPLALKHVTVVGGRNGHPASAAFRSVAKSIN